MRGFRRPIIAVLAAYALTLQALLAAFAPSAFAAAPTETAFAICKPSADTGGNPAHQDRHESCLACLAGHCVAAAGPARDASLVPWSRSAVPAPPPARYVARVALTPRSRPHAPRAPPAG